MIRRLAWIIALPITVFAFYAIAPDPLSNDYERFGLFDRVPGVADANLKAWAIADTLRAVNSAYQRSTAWETARTLAPDPAPIKVITMSGLVPSTARVFEDALRNEFATLPAPRVPIRVVLAPEARSTGFYQKQTVIPQSAEQPCVVVIPIPARAQNIRIVRGDRLLGTCGFYARFGIPGSGMREWLERTQGIAAVFDTVIRPPRPAEKRTELKGGQIGTAPSVAACLAGDDEGCAQTVLNPSDIRFRPASRIVPANERTTPVFISFGVGGYIGPSQTLASIREHVGDARFEQIWTSSEDPAAAYQIATGEHIAAFARPMLLNEALPHHPGPLRGGVSLILGLSIGVTAAVFAIKRTRRERS